MNWYVLAKTLHPAVVSLLILIIWIAGASDNSLIRQGTLAIMMFISLLVPAVYERTFAMQQDLEKITILALTLGSLACTVLAISESATSLGSVFAIAVYGAALLYVISAATLALSKSGSRIGSAGLVLSFLYYPVGLWWLYGLLRTKSSPTSAGPAR